MPNGERTAWPAAKPWHGFLQPGRAEAQLLHQPLELIEAVKLDDETPRSLLFAGSHQDLRAQVIAQLPLEVRPMRRGRGR
jgi:hypothetical protein